MHAPVTVIVPVKALSQAKSRLADEVDAPARRALVVWMFGRVIDACKTARSVGDVLVVAGDDEAAALAAQRGVRVLVERRPGLAAALTAGDRAVGKAAASLVVAADLPLVHAEDLDRVCAAGQHAQVVVAPTRDGGTGALLRCPPTVMGTAYGPGSAAAHLALARDAGVPALSIDVAGLALDVDTAGQLREARRRLGAGVESPRTHVEEGPRMPQGTVKYFDYETNSGTVLLDNADELPIDAETFAASGLLELRLGQRVRFEIEEGDGSRRLRDLTIVSL